MSRSLSTNLWLKPGSISIYGKFYLCCTTLDFFWSVNCANMVYKLCITFLKCQCQDTKNIFVFFFIGVYLVLTWMERFFSTACYFLSYYCWSVNCMSRVNKFHNFFWHAEKLRPGVYLRAFSNVIYGKFSSN